MKQYFSKPIYTKINPAKKTDLLNMISEVASEAIFNSPTYPTAIFAEIEEAASQSVYPMQVVYELRGSETKSGNPFTFTLPSNYFEIQPLNCTDEEFESYAKKVFSPRPLSINKMKIKIISVVKNNNLVSFQEV